VLPLEMVNKLDFFVQLSILVWVIEAAGSVSAIAPTSLAV